MCFVFFLIDNQINISSKKSSKSSFNQPLIQRLNTNNFGDHHQSTVSSSNQNDYSFAGDSHHNHNQQQQQQHHQSNMIESSNSSSISNYTIHEQTEKKFRKWLNEIRQSLDFIENGLSAESAIINNDGDVINCKYDDGALYSNVSEMQQMHMNYYEKIKVRNSLRVQLNWFQNFSHSLFFLKTGKK